MQHIYFCIAEDNILMRQIPELLFMTDTSETADKNGVYTLNFKLYISSSCLNKMDATQNNALKTHVKNGRSGLMAMRHRMKALALIYQTLLQPQF